MGRCCYTKPIGENPPTAYNAVSFDANGDFRWAVSWPAVLGEGQHPGAMTVRNDFLGYPMIKIVDGVLLAVGEKDGTFHSAALDPSDGTTALSLTDTGITTPNFFTTLLSISNCVGTSTDLVIATAEGPGLSSDDVTLRRFEFDVSGNGANQDSTTYSQTGGLGALLVADDGHAGAWWLDPVGQSLRLISVDGTGQTGTQQQNVVGVSGFLNPAGDGYLWVRIPPAAEGAWYKDTLPIGGSSALSAVGDTTMLGIGSKRRENNWFASTVDSDHIWYQDVGASNRFNDAIIYHDMTATGDARSKWNSTSTFDGFGYSLNLDIASFGGIVRQIASVSKSLDPSDTLFLVMADLNGRTYISSVTRTGTIRRALHGQEVPFHYMPNAVGPIRGWSPATDKVWVSNRASGNLISDPTPGGASREYYATEYGTSGSEHVENWKWQVAQPLCATTDGSGNSYWVGDKNTVNDRAYLTRLI